MFHYFMQTVKCVTIRNKKDYSYDEYTEVLTPISRWAVNNSVELFTNDGYFSK